MNADTNWTAAAVAIFLMPGGPASASAFHSMYSFCAAAKQLPCRTGGGPTAPLVMDQDGNLFGTTIVGGPHDGKGTIFAMMRGSGNARRYKLLHGFAPRATAATAAQSSVR